MRECVATLTRPGFSPDFYPYAPPHVTNPAETLKLFAVALPDRLAFAVAGHVRLVAVPLMDLFGGGPPRWGAPAASIPLAVARLRLSLAVPAVREAVPAPGPAGTELGAGRAAPALAAPPAAAAPAAAAAIEAAPAADGDDGSVQVKAEPDVA